MNRDRTYPLRSQNWFANPDNIGMTAVYLERYANYGLTREELQSGRPIVGIAQTGSDLSPCNRIHLELEQRVKEGIRDAGGVPMAFPVHPLFENCRRPTAALDRNLAYLGLVEILHGYFFDGVVLMTGCDKTTPACLMAVATVDLPAIVLSGGPMVNSYFEGKIAGSGMNTWEGRRRYAAGEIDADRFVELIMASAPSAGHCNTMGTASSMNSLAEAMGMSLPGCAMIPAPHRERFQMAYATGRRIVDMVKEDLRPSRILTRAAFENAIRVCSAIGGSTNCPPHLVAIAKHMGVDLTTRDWELGHDVPLLANVQPAGEYLGADFHRAGGVPAVMAELLRVGLLAGEAMTVSGKTVREAYAGAKIWDEAVIHRFEQPVAERAGFLVVGGNLFSTALVKTSVIGEEFQRRFLSEPGNEDVFTVKAIVFEGPEDYHERINDAELGVDENSMLVVRGCGPVGYPGSAEVVNMLPPDALVQRGVGQLPTMGDGRQSGTSASPSILNASPESAVGGNLAILRTGDQIRVDLKARTVDVLLPEKEIAARRAELRLTMPASQTPWQEFYRAHVTQLEEGAVLEFALKYHKVGEKIPRHNH